MKPNEEYEPSTPEFENEQGDEQETFDIDETAKELYNEENYGFVETVESTPPILLDMFVRGDVNHELYTVLEKLQILAARAGVGTFEAGSRKPEKSEGAFSAFAAVSLPQGVLERNSVSWEQIDEQFQKAIGDFNDWLEEHFKPLEEEEDDE